MHNIGMLLAQKKDAPFARIKNKIINFLFCFFVTHFIKSYFAIYFNCINGAFEKKVTKNLITVYKIFTKNPL